MQSYGETRFFGVTSEFVCCFVSAVPGTWQCRWWRLSKEILEKVLSQPWQPYRLMASCVCMCARRFDRSAKALEHFGHLYGFSPARENKQVYMMETLS